MSKPLNRRDWLRTAGLAALGAGVSVPPRLFGSELERPPPEGRHVNLAGNENPFGPSPDVVRAIYRAAPLSCHYPFREEYVLKELLAKKEDVPVDHIVLGNGCDEILALAAAALLRPGSAMIASDPTYFQLSDYAEKLGADVHRIPHRAATMQHDLPALAAAVGPQTRLIYVCNPDNPSGTSVSASELTAFGREVASRAVVVIDEVYLELGDDFASRTQVPLVRAGLPVIITRSFSKMYGLAGHRIGYAITTPGLAESLSKYQMSSVNFLGVAAARAALLDPPFADWSRRKIREGRTRFCALLDELQLRYTPSEGNFVFHATGVPVREYQERMKARGFLVGWPHAPVAAYPDWCRISVGTDQEMAKFAEAMRAEFACTKAQHS